VLVTTVSFAILNYLRFEHYFVFIALGKNTADFFVLTYEMTTSRGLSAEVKAHSAF